ncbi:MAG: hypothetical protein EBS19_13970, partial [Spirochaetia bacterium]|nr:hypothetical protein [Spirochaetia bacterium]
MSKSYVIQKDVLSYSEAISIKIDPPTIRLLPSQNPLEEKLITLHNEFIIKDIQFKFNSQEVLMDDVLISDLKVNIPTELTENVYFSAEYVGENNFPRIQLDKLGTYGLTKFRFSRVVYLLKEPTKYVENGITKLKIEVIECFLAKMDTAIMIYNGGSGIYDNYWLQFDFPILKDGAKWYAHSPEIESQGLYPVISKTDSGLTKNILKIEYPLLTLKNSNDGSFQFISSPFDTNVFGGSYIEMGKVWEHFQDFSKAMEFYAPQSFSTITIYSKADGRAISYNRTDILSLESVSPQLVVKQFGGAIAYVDQTPNTETTITGLKITVGLRNIQFPTFKIKPYYSFYSAMNGIVKPDKSYFDIITVKIYNSESYIETKSVTVFYDVHLLE